MYPKPHYPIPKPQRLRREYVTIAAGFVCEDGVVLCADTEETGSGFKRRVIKLQTMPNGPPSSRNEPVAVFTGSGDAAFVDEVIEEMWNGVLDSGEQELVKIIKRLQYENRRYHTTIYHCYPSATRPELLPEADLLFAVWAKDGFGLFRARGTMFSRVRKYAAIGCGGELSDYICEDAHRSTDETVRAFCLAVYMLRQTTTYVSGCGGESHIAVLTKNGQVNTYAGSEVINSSIYLGVTDRILKEILIDSGNLDIADETFKRKVTGYAQALIQNRKRQRREIAHFRKKMFAAASKALAGHIPKPSKPQKSTDQP
jgi:hypothetical protein